MSQGEGPQPVPTTGGTRFSPDGYWFWDGSDWRPTISPDGAWRWNGSTWVAAGFGPARRPGPDNRALVLLIAGVVILVLLIVSIFTYGIVRGLNSLQKSASARTAASGIRCDLLEQTEVHYHAALQILNQGAQVDIPTDLGRTLGCYYWIHMHDFEPGIIHIESPTNRAYTLGDFFSVWTAWSGQPQRLDLTHVGSITLSGGETVVTYIDLSDGNGAQLFAGDPNTIILAEHEVITLEISPPTVSPPPTFVWPDGF